MRYARDHGNVVILRLRDIPGIPTDLSPITLVYSLGDAQDVLAIVEGGEDLTIRNEFLSPLEESAVRAAIAHA